MEAFDEVPITGLVLKNVDITNVGTDIRALNWEDPILENVSINGKSYPRPVETKMIGTPVPGEKIEGSSVLLGGDSSELTYEWKMADAVDGSYETVGTDKTFSVPADAAGKYLTLTAADKKGNTQTSMAYKILKEKKAAGVTDDEEVIRAAVKGYIDEDEVLDLNREITNRDCAKLLGKLWGLTAPKETVVISDVPESDPDYGVIAAVVEAEMMNLKDPNATGAQGTLYNAGVTQDEAAKRTAFLPDASINRDEMGYIALLSCGVPYNETLGTEPKFDDAAEIDSAYEDNVGASQYLGFVEAKEGNKYMPKDKTTLGELIHIVTRISDFANK